MSNAASYTSSSVPTRVTLMMNNEISVQNSSDDKEKASRKRDWREMSKDAVIALNAFTDVAEVADESDGKENEFIYLITSLKSEEKRRNDSKTNGTSTSTISRLTMTYDDVMDGSDREEQESMPIVSKLRRRRRRNYDEAALSFEEFDESSGSDTELFAGTHVRRPKRDADNKWLCYVNGCGKSISGGVSKWKRHYRAMHLNKMFVCEHKDCRKSYAEKKNLDAHIAHFHKEGFDCPFGECSFSDKHETSLAQHLEDFHQAHEYRCDYEGCDKLYYCSSHLRRHVRAVHENVRHVCPAPNCRSTFASRAGLFYHRKTKHEGVSYPCEEPGCDSIFTTRFYLNHHVRSVHKGKRFTCYHEGCDKSYTTMGSVEDHVKRDHLGSKKKRRIIRNK